MLMALRLARTTRAGQWRSSASHSRWRARVFGDVHRNRRRAYPRHSLGG